MFGFPLFYFFLTLSPFLFYFSFSPGFVMLFICVCLFSILSLPMTIHCDLLSSCFHSCLPFFFLSSHSSFLLSFPLLALLPSIFPSFFPSLPPPSYNAMLQDSMTVLQPWVALHKADVRNPPTLLHQTFAYLFVDDLISVSFPSD